MFQIVREFGGCMIVEADNLTLMQACDKCDALEIETRGNVAFAIEPMETEDNVL